MIIFHLVSSLNIGGIERLMVSIAQANLSDGDNEIYIFVINQSYCKELVGQILETNVHLIFLNRAPGETVGTICKLINFRIFVKTIRPDIIHIHNKFSLLFGCLGCLGLGVPCVFSLHAMRMFSGSFADRFAYFISGIFVAGVIAISESVKADYCKFNSILANRMIRVIPNGIDLSCFTPSLDSVVNSSRFKIICVGRLVHEIKGQDLLIRALSDLSIAGYDFECIFVGDGPSRSFLTELVSQYKLNSFVYFAGQSHDVLRLLQSSDLFVMPSRYEGFGIALVEAMACGLPVIAADIDGPREIVKHGLSGLLFKADDVEDLKNNIMLLLDDKLLGTRLSVGGINESRKYSVNTMYDEYLDFYVTCVG